MLFCLMFLVTDSLFAITHQSFGPFKRTIRMWDTASDKRYRTIIPIYLREASGVVLAYDSTDPESLLCLEK
jgi:GTPase SAR1 family protein